MEVTVSSSHSGSPSPSHSNIHYFFKLLFDHKSPKGPHLITQMWVIVTFILLVVLFFIGRIRSYVRVGWYFRYATKIVYILIPILITYIIGLMHNAPTFHVLYSVWACALIYAYGGVITMTACDLSDNDNTLPTLPLLFWSFWMAMVAPIFKSDTRAYGISQTGSVFQIFWFSIFGIFLVVASLNTMETLEAFYLASKSNGLPGLVGPVVRYMRDARDVPNELVADPASMKGYRYVVWGDPAEGDITTTEEIWESISTNSLISFVSVKRLRDMCLSYAFFRLILRRFADCPLYERSQPKTRRFIREGLLSNVGNQQLKISERAFGIIEVELAFLFDFFYTKSYVCSSYKFRDMSQHLCFAALLLCFGSFGISYLASLDKDIFERNYVNISFHGHSLEVGVTMVVTIVFAILEFGKFVMVCFSNRKMVWFICTSRLNMEGYIIDKVIVHLWTIKDHLCNRYVFLSRPWRRKLSQYSFLESYAQVPLLSRKPFSRLAKVMKLPRVGQHGEFSVALSAQVKEAIIESLLPHVQDDELALSRGTATVTRNQLSACIFNTCQLETDAHVILVWHIATCICELSRAPQGTGDPNYEHFLVATQLSKYCAYLVSFAPELLPDHPYTTENVFDTAVKQAQRDMEGCDISQRYELLRTMNQRDRNGEDNIVVKGALLGGTLMVQVLNNPARGWRVLAEFWAELLLYLALSNNVAVHGEYLARGGEFITHVWALLTHAGIVSRN